jgi:hypothetical protein
MRNVHKILIGKSEGTRPLGIPRCRREIILKWILKTEYDVMDWIYLAQNMVQLQAV